MAIDPEVLANLQKGLYTCYWCGAVEDDFHIVAHVKACLEQIKWLREHVEGADNGTS